MSASAILILAFLALLTLAIARYIASTYKRVQVFQAMGITYISPFKSRWEAQKNIFLKKRHVGALDAKQVAEHGPLFGKLEIQSEPVVIVTDTDLLRDIFVKQFNNFCNRREFPGGGTKLFAESVFFQRDQRWRDIRSLISPTFTTGKLHSMDAFILDCLNVMQRELNGRIEKNDGKTVELDAKNYFSNFAMDVVGTVFFGVGVDAINNRDHPFVQHALNVFRSTSFFRIMLFRRTGGISNSKSCVIVLTPGKFLRRQLLQRGLMGMGKPSRDYFEVVIPGMISQRRKHMESEMTSAKSDRHQRKDFISVLISAREKAMTNEAMTASGNLHDENDDDSNINAGVEKTNGAVANGHQLPRTLQNGASAASGQALHQENGKSIGDNIQTAKAAAASLTDDEIAGQIFIFLVAGFETTATTIGFLFHELALDQDVQDRLRAEITDALDGGTPLNYDTVAELKLLDACVNETLRLYPPVSRLERECAQDCTLSNGMQVKKGVIVGIPAWYIHRSAENFVDPEKFDPDRFYDPERRAQIKPYTYMPFGQGPRNCVGMRFALLELKMVAAFVVQHYRIVPTEKTVHPVPLEGGAVGLTRPRYGAFVGIETL